MPKILFPAGLTIDFHDLNMEEMEFYARAWNLERIQMQKGLFHGSMIATNTPHMQLMGEQYSHGLLMQGDFPKGTILIGVVVTKADVTFQNKIVAKHEIKILKSGDEVDFLCNGENEIFTIAVEEQFFYEAYNAHFGEDFHTYQKHKPIYVDPHVFPLFVQGIEHWISYLMQDHGQLKIEKHYKRIESEILEHVFSSIYIGKEQKPRQKFQIKEARDLLHQFIDEPMTISELRKELGISERLLYDAFKSNYGVTPKKYLLALRMHKVKEELLLADPGRTTISAVIEKYNFFNHNTFTQAYKQMFGELPSKAFQGSL